MKTSIIVQNLKNGGCAQTISSNLSKIGGISCPLVDVESGTVSFIHRNINDALAVKDKLKSIGYPSIDRKSAVASNAIAFGSNASRKLVKV